jgi:amidase
LGLTAVGLTDAIRARHWSCAEVMDATLDHIEAVNGIVNAIVALRDRDTLLAEARAMDSAIARATPLGPLHGLPMAIKDLEPVKGLRTTFGSPIFGSFVAPEDSLMAGRLRRAGAIFIGKTNTPEFGLGSHSYNNVYGATGNAYDPALSAGGSSGGAAVAVALRMTSLADGSDFGGSLRNPPGWNNVFGLRPSFGRVPAASRTLWGGSMSVHGPIARNVPDLALLLSVQAGYDARAPLSMTEDPRGLAPAIERDIAGCRLAWLGDWDGALPFEPGVLDTCGQALTVFERLGCIVEAKVPAFPLERLLDAWSILRTFHTGSALIEHYRNPKERILLKPEALFEVEEFLRLTAAEIASAEATRTAWYEVVRHVFDEYDAFLLPTAQVFAFPIDRPWPTSIAGRPMTRYYDWMQVAFPVTLSGCPAIAVPAGFGPSGLPMGLQIVAPHHGDALCLQIAHAYDKATGWPARRPPPLLLNEAASLGGA